MGRKKSKTRVPKPNKIRKSDKQAAEEVTVADLLNETFSIRSIRKRLGWWDIPFDKTGDKMQLAKTLAENAPLSRFPTHDIKQMCTHMGINYMRSLKVEFHVDKLNGLLRETQAQRQRSQQDMNTLVDVDSDVVQVAQDASRGVDTKPQPDQVGSEKEDVLLVPQQDHDAELSTGSDSVVATMKPHLTIKCFEDWDATKSVTQISKIKQSVMEIVNKYVEKVDAAFDSRTLPPCAKKFDPTPGAPLRLVDSACSGTKYASQVIIADMKKLQALANAEHPESFLQDVRIKLHGWQNFFSSHFTEEINKMITKINGLIKEIDDESGLQLHSTTMELSDRKKQVDEMLEDALLVREEITQSVKEIGEVRLAGERSNRSIKVLKTEHNNKVQRLEKEIQELQRQLADEKESIRLLESLEAKHAGFFAAEMAVSEAIAVSSSSLENVGAKGKALSEEIAKRLQQGEEYGGLPAPVQALRSLMARYPIKE